MKKTIALLLFFSFLCTTCFAAGELTSYTKVKWLGINPRINPKLLSDDEAADASNITLEESGAFRDRDTFGQYNSSSGVLGSNAIAGLFKYYTPTSKSFIACAGNKVALGSGGAFSTDISPTTNSVTSGTFWSAVTFKEYEYFFNPSIPMMKYGSGFNGGTNLHSPSGTPTTNCAYGAAHKSRVWAARSDSVPYRAYYSSLNSADDWVTTGGYIDLPDTTLTITGLISWGGYLFIFTETSIYTLQGSTPTDFALRKTNSQVGAIAPRSIKITDIGIVFLSRIGLFAFNGNSSDKLSDKVEPLINDISKTQIQNACGVYDGQGRYWLSYTHKTGSFNNRILIYDTILKEWYPYNNLNINYFERAYGGTDKGELYGGSSTANGIVWLLQEAAGTESVTHDTESDFLNGTTFNTVIQNNPLVNLQHGDFLDSFTKLLVHFNGTDAAASYTTEDSSKRIVTFSGDAVLDSDFYKFGTTSLQLNGVANTYAYVPTSTDWTFGTGDFTIDFWVRFNSTAAQDLLGQYNDGSNYWTVHLNGAKALVLYWINGGVEKAQFTSTNALSISTGTWYHIAIVRNGSTCLMFLNGESLAVTQNVAFGNLVYVAGDNLNFGKNLVQGWSNSRMDEIRISNIARWTATFASPNTEYNASRYGTLTSRGIQINAAGATTLDTISWIGSYPSNTKLTFQTRTGTTNDSVYFNGWQYWSSASSVTFDTVTSSAVTSEYIAWKSSDDTNFIVSRSTAMPRNELYFEDEDSISPNYVMFVTQGAASTDKYCDWTVPPKDLSSYNWLAGWYQTPATGNSVELWIGEDSPKYRVTLNTVNFNNTNNTVQPTQNWNKWYYYIGDIASTDRDAINYIRVKYKGDKAGYVIIGETSAYNFYDTGDTMTSATNDWIQYRGIFASNTEAQAPLLTSLTLAYTPAAGTLENSISSNYKTKFLDFGTPQVNKQYLDFFVDVYTDSDSTKQPFYFDYDIDNGAKTGTITIASANMVTNNSIKIKKYFPSSAFGRTMQLNYRNPDAKTSKHTIRQLEIRSRSEPMN